MKTSERIVYLFSICAFVAIGKMILLVMATQDLPTNKVFTTAMGAFLGAPLWFLIFSGIAWLVSRLFGGSLRSIATIAAVLGGGVSWLSSAGKLSYVERLARTHIDDTVLIMAILEGILMGTAAYFFAKVLFAKSEKKIKAEEEAQRILKALSKSEIKEHAARILKERERKREEEARKKAEEERRKAEEERLKREEEEKARREQRLKDLESLSDEELQKLVSSKQVDIQHVCSLLKNNNQASEKNAPQQESSEEGILQVFLGIILLVLGAIVFVGLIFLLADVF